MSFPIHRTRRLRRTAGLRDLVRETRIHPADLVNPIFVCGADNAREPIRQLPGVDLLSGEPLLEEARRIGDLGIQAILLFAVVDPREKNEQASLSHSSLGPMQRAIEALKRMPSGPVTIADLCLCEYNSLGHCGLLQRGEIDNDSTLEILAKAAVSLADSGADVIAPSGVMDGTVKAIRAALDAHGHEGVAIMSYSAKFASPLYAPFKEATCSPAESKHATHQLDPGNANQALMRIGIDVNEGADMIIVKPALFYLDIVARARQRFDVPIAAFNVSGEYNMLRAAGVGGPNDNGRLLMEMLTSIKRAGADIIITYFAKQAAKLLRS